MNTQTLNPITIPTLVHLQFGMLKPGKKYYKCVRCNGNLRTQLCTEIYKPNEILFRLKCHDCGKRWFISSKLILNDILEEQISRIAHFTEVTKKEFGAFIIKTKDGIRLDMVEIGEDLSVSFKQTHELNDGEKIVGSWHSHPLSGQPSDWDIGTFLRDNYEKISIVSGVKGTVTVMIKTPETIKILDVKEWVKKFEELSLKEKGNLFNFLIYRGKINNLQLISGKSNSPFASLEGILKTIE